MHQYSTILLGALVSFAFATTVYASPAITTCHTGETIKAPILLKAGSIYRCQHAKLTVMGTGGFEVAKDSSLLLDDVALTVSKHSFPALGHAWLATLHAGATLSITHSTVDADIDVPAPPSNHHIGQPQGWLLYQFSSGDQGHTNITLSHNHFAASKPETVGLLKLAGYNPELGRSHTHKCAAWLQ